MTPEQSNVVTSSAELVTKILARQHGIPKLFERLRQLDTSIEGERIPLDLLRAQRLHTISMFDPRCEELTTDQLQALATDPGVPKHNTTLLREALQRGLITSEDRSPIQIVEKDDTLFLVLANGNYRELVPQLVGNSPLYITQKTDEALQLIEHDYVEAQRCESQSRLWLPENVQVTIVLTHIADNLRLIFERAKLLGLKRSERPSIGVPIWMSGGQIEYTLYNPYVASQQLYQQLLRHIKLLPPAAITNKELEFCHTTGTLADNDFNKFAEAISELHAFSVQDTKRLAVVQATEFIGKKSKQIVTFSKRSHARVNAFSGMLAICFNPDN